MFRGYPVATLAKSKVLKAAFGTAHSDQFIRLIYDADAQHLTEATLGAYHENPISYLFKPSRVMSIFHSNYDVLHDHHNIEARDERNRKKGNDIYSQCVDPLDFNI